MVIRLRLQGRAAAKKKRAAAIDWSRFAGGPAGVAVPRGSPVSSASPPFGGFALSSGCFVFRRTQRQELCRIPATHASYAQRTFVPYYAIHRALYGTKTAFSAVHPPPHAPARACLQAA